jgi:hypothetical protein
VTTHTQNRLFAAFGIGSVVIELVGVVVGAIGNRNFVTITSSPADVRAAFAKPVTTAAWAGAYIELLSFGLFLGFAIWACGRLGGGLLGAVAAAFATAYATLSIASLGVGDTLSYRSGHGMSLQLATTLTTLNEALFVCTWFLIVFFLLAAGPMALARGRTVLGWSAIAVAAIILVTTAVSLDTLGQFSNLLWLVWIIGASVSLARSGSAEPVAAEIALA